MRVPNLKTGERIALLDTSGSERQYRVLTVVNGDTEGYSGAYDLTPLDGGPIETLHFDKWREAVADEKGRVLG